MFHFNDLNFDLDGDGVLDSHAELMDLDGDGIADYAEIDIDGDGNADAVLIDSNHDGVWDVGMIDSNLDGVLDTELIDSDLDGIMDTIGMDSNGDGVIDTYHTALDTNHDGSIDTIMEKYDYNQDGTLDGQTIYHDGNHDGVYEEVVKVHDSDGDGIMDTAVTYQDFDGDGNEDLIITEKLTGTGHSAETVAGTYADDLGNFNPASADMGRVSGNPQNAMEEWEYQGDTGRCALYAQKFVIEELTDTEIDMEELAKLAEENGWFSEQGGTPMLNMDKVLDYYGIDSDMSFHNDISDIEECLQSGGKIIVAVDADEIWYGEQDDLFTPGDGANHAVEVIGIDRTNPDDAMVILNDSGNPNGCGEMVPLETFLDAWEDGNCQMITCMDVCAHQG